MQFCQEMLRVVIEGTVCDDDKEVHKEEKCTKSTLLRTLDATNADRSSLEGASHSL